MFATASQVRRWLLIEVRGAWGRDAIADSALARYASSDWQKRLQAEHVRVIAIRRDLDRSSEDALQMFYVDSGKGADRGRCWRRRVPTLHAAVGATAALPFDDNAEPIDWTSHRDPLVLVCTNGRHDPCCATFGRPLARDLRQHPRSDDVWECSHIGGDRFAANIVILPEGLYFGRCDTAAAERVIEDYGQGAISLDNYRGRSALGFYEQAAEYYVRRELAVTAIDAVTAVRRVDATRGVFAVDLTTDGKQRTVEIQVARREEGALTPLTCTGPSGQRVPSYELVSIHEGE